MPAGPPTASLRAGSIDRRRISSSCAGKSPWRPGGAIALTEPEHAVAEISRALDKDGLTGVALPTSAAGRPLDDPAFEPLFAECARRGVIVFMHPTTGVERPAFGQYTMLQLVGWPSETGLCVARLIFAGIFERHPGLKLVLAHGGGTLAMLAGRLDLGLRGAALRSQSRLPQEHLAPSEFSYLKQIYLRHRGRASRRRCVT